MNQVIVFPGFYSAIVVCDPSEYADSTPSPGLIPLAPQKGFFGKSSFTNTVQCIMVLKTSSRTAKSPQKGQGREQKGKTERVQTCWEPGNQEKKKQQEVALQIQASYFVNTFK